MLLAWFASARARRLLRMMRSSGRPALARRVLLEKAAGRAGQRRRWSGARGCDRRMLPAVARSSIAAKDACCCLCEELRFLWTAPLVGCVGRQAAWSLKRAARSRIITGSGTSINRLLASLDGLPVLLLWCVLCLAAHAPCRVEIHMLAWRWSVGTTTEAAGKASLWRLENLPSVLFPCPRACTSSARRGLVLARARAVRWEGALKVMWASVVQPLACWRVQGRQGPLDPPGQRRAHPWPVPGRADGADPGRALPPGAPAHAPYDVQSLLSAVP
jgi:hypothetical protein